MENEHFYQTCLRLHLSKKIAVNSSYSLRAFARYLGISPSILSRVINGTKRLGPNLANIVIQRLELDPAEAKMFLYSVAKTYEDKSIKRRDPAIKKILNNKAPVQERDLSLEVFKIISDWHHYALLQLIETESFTYDTKWISSELQLPENEIILAIQRLIELDFIRLESGKLVRNIERLNAGDPTLTSIAHKKRIRQITEKSLESLETDDISKRNHSTITMAIDPEMIPEAKEMIDAFMDELSRKLESKKSRVYELQINLFPLQRNTK